MQPPVKLRERASKSLLVAYILWIFGGWCCLHLLYLRRRSQAFVYWWSLGGYLGCGIIRDFFKIPQYLRECNCDILYIIDFKDRSKKFPRPPLSPSRMVGQVLVGNMWSLLVCSALPEELLSENAMLCLATLLAPFACAVAVWLIGNIGAEQEGGFKWALIGAYVPTPGVLTTGTQALNCCAVPSMVLFSRYSRRWRVVPKCEKTSCKDVLYLAMGSLLFIGMFSSYFYFNATIYSQGEKVKLRDAVGYFIRSPMFEEFKTNAYKIYNETRHEGFKKGWECFIELMDPFGTHYALKVLDLPQNSTQSAIKERVRTLSKKWHPDKHTGEEEKKTAQEKFLEVQKAGEVLLEERKRRARSNKKNVEPDPDQEFDPDF